MEDNFDIYDDLDEFTTQTQKPSDEVLELREEVKKVTGLLNEARQKHEKLQNLNKTLKNNISSILLTARRELQRKEERINELIKEKDAIVFRRTGHHAKAQAPQTQVQTTNISTQTPHKTIRDVGVLTDNAILKNKYIQVESEESRKWLQSIIKVANQSSQTELNVRYKNKRVQANFESSDVLALSSNHSAKNQKEEMNDDCPQRVNENQSCMIVNKQSSDDSDIVESLLALSRGCSTTNTPPEELNDKDFEKLLLDRQKLLDELTGDEHSEQARTNKDIYDMSPVSPEVCNATEMETIPKDNAKRDDTRDTHARKANYTDIKTNCNLTHVVPLQPLKTKMSNSYRENLDSRKKRLQILFDSPIKDNKKWRKSKDKLILKRLKTPQKQMPNDNPKQIKTKKPREAAIESNEMRPHTIVKMPEEEVKNKLETQIRKSDATKIESQKLSTSDLKRSEECKSKFELKKKPTHTITTMQEEVPKKDQLKLQSNVEPTIINIETHSDSKQPVTQTRNSDSTKLTESKKHSQFIDVKTSEEELENSRIQEEVRKTESFKRLNLQPVVHLHKICPQTVEQTSELHSEPEVVSKERENSLTITVPKKRRQSVHVKMSEEEQEQCQLENEITKILSDTSGKTQEKTELPVKQPDFKPTVPRFTSVAQTIGKTTEDHSAAKVDSNKRRRSVNVKMPKEEPNEKALPETELNVISNDLLETVNVKMFETAREDQSEMELMKNRPCKILKFEVPVPQTINLAKQLKPENESKTNSKSMKRRQSTHSKMTEGQNSGIESTKNQPDTIDKVPDKIPTIQSKRESITIQPVQIPQIEPEIQPENIRLATVKLENNLEPEVDLKQFLKQIRMSENDSTKNDSNKRQQSTHVRMSEEEHEFQPVIESKKKQTKLVGKMQQGVPNTEPKLGSMTTNSVNELQLEPNNIQAQSGKLENDLMKNYPKNRRQSTHVRMSEEEPKYKPVIESKKKQTKIIGNMQAQNTEEKVDPIIKSPVKELQLEPKVQPDNIQTQSVSSENDLTKQGSKKRRQSTHVRMSEEEQEFQPVIESKKKKNQLIGKVQAEVSNAKLKSDPMTTTSVKELQLEQKVEPNDNKTQSASSENDSMKKDSKKRRQSTHVRMSEEEPECQSVTESKKKQAILFGKMQEEVKNNKAKVPMTTTTVKELQLEPKVEPNNIQAQSCKLENELMKNYPKKRRQSTHARMSVEEPEYKPVIESKKKQTKIIGKMQDQVQNTEEKVNPIIKSPVKELQLEPKVQPDNIQIRSVSSENDLTKHGSKKRRQSIHVKMSEEEQEYQPVIESKKKKNQLIGKVQEEIPNTELKLDPITTTTVKELQLEPKVEPNNIQTQFVTSESDLTKHDSKKRRQSTHVRMPEEEHEYKPGIEAKKKIQLFGKNQVKVSNTEPNLNPMTTTPVKELQLEPEVQPHNIQTQFDKSENNLIKNNLNKRRKQSTNVKMAEDEQPIVQMQKQALERVSRIKARAVKTPVKQQHKEPELHSANIRLQKRSDKANVKPVQMQTRESEKPVPDVPWTDTQLIPKQKEETKRDWEEETVDAIEKLLKSECIEKSNIMEYEIESETQPNINTFPEVLAPNQDVADITTINENKETSVAEGMDCLPDGSVSAVHNASLNSSIEIKMSTTSYKIETNGDETTVYIKRNKKKRKNT